MKWKDMSLSGFPHIRMTSESSGMLRKPVGTLDESPWMIVDRAGKPLNHLHPNGGRGVKHHLLTLPQTRYQQESIWELHRYAAATGNTGFNWRGERRAQSSFMFSAEEPRIKSLFSLVAIVSERRRRGRGGATSYADEMLMRQKVKDVWTRTNEAGGRVWEWSFIPHPHSSPHTLVMSPPWNFTITKIVNINCAFQSFIDSENRR